MLRTNDKKIAKRFIKRNYRIKKYSPDIILNGCLVSFSSDMYAVVYPGDIYDDWGCHTHEYFNIDDLLEEIFALCNL